MPWLDNGFGRWLTRGNNRANGNYVSPQRHFGHDSSYWGHWKGANYREWGKRLSPGLALLDSIPNVWWGVGAGALYGATAAGGGCECK